MSQNHAVERQSIDPYRLVARPHTLWARQWLLLSAGDFAKDDFNVMTVAWGSLGFMWQKPFVQVVVRPTRYTYEFMERYPTFTLCAFGEDHRQALSVLGSRSGRDGDKISGTGLTPTAASAVAAPVFAEAELALECRRIYQCDLDAGQFLDPTIHEHYPQKDYHRVYFGRILAVSGTGDYLSKKE